MKLSLLTAALLFAQFSAAACLPKEAGGTGTPMQLHASTHGTVIGWRCGAAFQWLGTRRREFAPYQMEDLLIRQLAQLKAENAADPAMRADLRHAATELETKTAR